MKSLFALLSTRDVGLASLCANRSGASALGNGPVRILTKRQPEPNGLAELQRRVPVIAQDKLTTIDDLPPTGL
jgi:hypothetical protein